MEVSTTSTSIILTSSIIEEISNNIISDQLKIQKIYLM